MDGASSGTQFEVVEDRQPTGDVLVCGLTAFGLAGLTAVDYLVDQTSLDQCGYVRSTAATITPFTDGTPRHPVRVYDSPDLAPTVLVGEVPVARDDSRSFTSAVVEWAIGADIDEVVVLSGVPGPHGPEDHRTFSVATPDYQAARLPVDGPVPPMGSGFLDGVPASFLTDGIDTSLRVGVFVTPVHGQVPDADAALRLLETLVEVYDLPVDTGPLASFADQIQRHYADLAERLEMAADADRPEDRMYM